MAKAGKDARMYTILMAAYGLCGNAYRANALLRAMKDARVAPNREIYNLLISINGKEGGMPLLIIIFTFSSSLSPLSLSLLFLFISFQI